MKNLWTILNNLVQIQLKLHQKEQFKKITGPTGDLIVNKTADTVANFYPGKITQSALKTSITPMQTENTDEVSREIYIPLEKRQLLTTKDNY